MERLEIRKATDADIPAIYDIIKKAQGFLKARGLISGRIIILMKIL